LREVREDIDQLAAIAHHLWCQERRAHGWRYGDQFNVKERTHDALVPFERLGEADRIAARRAVEAEEIPAQLAKLLTHSYSRGPCRDFVVDEMVVGLRVVFCANFVPPKVALPEQAGEVVEWETVDGELDLIRVRWANGTCTEFAANSGDLARFDELTEAE
jgi:hypothetical protein